MEIPKSRATLFVPFIHVPHTHTQTAHSEAQMTSRVCISQQQQQQHNNPLTSFCHVRVYYNISYSVPTNGPTQIKILKIGSDQRERKSRHKKKAVWQKRWTLDTQHRQTGNRVTAMQTNISSILFINKRYELWTVERTPDSRRMSRSVSADARAKKKCSTQQEQQQHHHHIAGAVESEYEKQ